MSNAVGALFGVLFSLVIWIGFGIYDYVVCPFVGRWIEPRRLLPYDEVKQKHLDTIDKVFINFNKAISILFVWHCVVFSITQPIKGATIFSTTDSGASEWAAWWGSGFNCDFTDVDAMLRSLLWFPAHAVLIFVIYDLFYTIFHWSLHFPKIYPLIHKHHHRQIAPFRGNVDAINVHPIEYVLGEYNHLFAVFIFTRLLGPTTHNVHVITFLLYIFIAGSLSSLNHTRIDLRVPYVYNVWAHDVHHRQPRSNYGQYTMFWDSIFGWYKPFRQDVLPSKEDR